ncbi:MAG: aldo/keto reductase [Planctomycetes bacterium]|nr:aldo/keto reductase [Planctomycetota bacterium]
MQTRPLGQSGIEASVVALGTWAIGGWMWGGSTERESIATIHAAIDNGMTFIDTAPVYGMGRSEEIVGAALRGSYRQKAILASKCSLVWDGTGEDGYYHFSADDQDKVDDGTPDPKYKIYRNGRPAHIRKGVEDSLRRLRTDVIALMQTHWQDPTTPIADTMHELLKLKKEGKIRAIGCSNATPKQMAEYLAVGPLDVDQEKFSMLDRDRTGDNLPFCKENNVAFLAYSPLGQGLLTGAVGPDRQFQPGDARNRLPRFSQENRRKVAGFLDAIRPIAEDYSLTLAQLVTAWTVAQPGCTHALLGARSVKQVLENVKGGAVTIDPRALEIIDKAIAERMNPEK